MPTLASNSASHRLLGPGSSSALQLREVAAGQELYQHGV